ncbi:hypothetical protein CEJ39_16830 [Rhodococcus pyridinivorans]|nr:DUF2510 domain-containing protein [Rhodococcus pyridinivorans]AWZ25614.1 hypothetical protein CEJ39_16830 [Rhodococcus pyridinivorans]
MRWWDGNSWTEHVQGGMPSRGPPQGPPPRSRIPCATSCSQSLQC